MPRIALLALASVLTALLAACGSGGAGTAATPSPTATATVVAPTEVVPSPTATLPDSPTAVPGSAGSSAPPPIIASAGGVSVTLGEGSYCWSSPGGPGVCVDKVGLPPSDAPLSVGRGATVTLTGFDWSTASELTAGIYNDATLAPLAVQTSGATASFVADLLPGSYTVSLFLRTATGNDASYGLSLVITGGGPSAAVTLGVGETVSVAGTDWSLTFTSVSEDSRCPLNVQCVWAGQAVVNFTATRGGQTTDPVSITLGGETMVPTPVGGLAVTVSDLSPYPVAGETIAAGDYVVTVIVALGS